MSTDWRRRSCRGRRFAPLSVAHGVAIAVLCYAWARADARARGILPPGRSAIYAGFLPAIGVPAYLLRTRGLAQGAAGTAKAFAFVLLLAVADGMLGEGTAWLLRSPS